MAEAVLITGAARRVGRAIAEGLAKKGHSLALHYNRSESEANNLLAMIEAGGGNAAIIQADLGQEQSLSGLVDKASKALGRELTVLVNNAASFVPDTVATADSTSWKTNLSINLRAPFFLSQAFANQIPEGCRANIINIIDQKVLRLTPEMLSYTVSKSALWTLTQLLAQALAPNVRVNAIGPGPTLKSIYQSDEKFAAEAASVPLGTGPALEEIVKGIEFILNMPSMTGQMLALDGGQHLAWHRDNHVTPRQEGDA